MAEKTEISWCDATFNPWMGCTKVSPACKHCYAERDMDHRYGKVAWGPNGTRVKTGETNWRKPMKWNGIAQAEKNLWEIIDESAGISTHDIGVMVQDPAVIEWLRKMRDRGVIVENERETGWIARAWRNPHVFCASLADVFEDWQGPVHDHRKLQLYTINGSEFFTEAEYPECRPATMGDLRRNLFELIDATPCLDWLLLTKRPENIQRMWPDRLAPHPMPNYRGQRDRMRVKRRQNVWLGCSVESQEYADGRLPHLHAAKREGLVGITFVSAEPLVGPVMLQGEMNGKVYDHLGQGGIDWVITGGESGPDARPMHPDWFRSLRDQCSVADVPFHFKQWGEWLPFGQSPEPEEWWNEDRWKSTIVGNVAQLRVGKKNAGRLLDGVEHNGIPETVSV